ncbi:MAG: hypothetical protein ACRD9R_17295 [Pyrinomonadaceae bacterium]
MSKLSVLTLAPSRFRAAFLLAFALMLAGGFTQNAGAQTRRERESRPGRIEISTAPGGFPLLVDGQAQGLTSPTVRYLELAPGTHTVEIQFPNNSRWVRTFNLEGGRKYCIALSYRPHRIPLPLAAESPCPYPVNLSAPSVVTEGSLVTFSADTGYAGAASALRYNWTVGPAPARIVGGDGTPTVTVDTTGMGRQRVNATLVVDDGSNDPACRQQVRASTLVNVTPPPAVVPRRFDEFPSIAFDDDKARLDNFAIELQNNPAATGYVIVYGGARSPANRAARLGRRAFEYLTLTRGIDASRIAVVNGGARERDTFELWLVPQGSPPPRPTPGASPPERPRSANR